MTEAEARKILGKTVQANNSLYRLGGYIAWPTFNNEVVLDGEFGAEEIEAIAWWVRNMKVTEDKT